MDLTKTQYPAKILLFGEHTILKGSSALATPFAGFKANWETGGTTKDDKLLSFAAYLAEYFTAEDLDAEGFKQDVERGYYLASNIPIGYGVGSSGAVCAAVLDRYGSEEIKQINPSALRSFFAKMESFFHGSSSGLDPLICYLQQALCLHADGTFSKVQVPKLKTLQLFLLDTKQPRQTGPLVQFFKDSYEKDAFRESVDQIWMPANEQAINSYLTGNEKELWAAFDQISAYQLPSLPPMIPDSIRGIWEEGLCSETYRLKICGAGGGGFMLGIAQKNVDLNDLFKDHHTIVIN